MNNWIRKTETKDVFLPLAAFECPKCGNVVIAFDENAKNNIRSRIKDYKFCPYCGHQIITELH